MILMAPLGPWLKVACLQFKEMLSNLVHSKEKILPAVETIN